MNDMQKPVIFNSCDDAFFVKYGGTFLASSILHGNKTVMSVVNASDKTKNILEHCYKKYVFSPKYSPNSTTCDKRFCLEIILHLQQVGN